MQLAIDRHADGSANEDDKSLLEIQTSKTSVLVKE
jgi:hypothetical protein